MTQHPSIIRRLKSVLTRKFWRKDDGSVTIDAMAAISIMSLGCTAFFVFWSAYQVQNRVQKATYTISDLISRQRGTTLTRNFLDGMETTAEFLMHDNQNAVMRITQVRRTSGTAASTTGLAVDWSYSPCGAKTALTTATMSEIRPKLPLIDLGAALIVVEMSVRFDPGFANVGLEPITYNGFLASLPRFEQQFSVTGAGTSTCL